MPQCLPSCSERSLGSRTPWLANLKPRCCLHRTHWAAELPGWPTSNQDAVFTEPKVRVLECWNPAALRNKKTCQAMPPPFTAHGGQSSDDSFGEERKGRNIQEATLPHSNYLELTSAQLPPPCMSTHMWCVCVSIYIYIYLHHTVQRIISQYIVFGLSVKTGESFTTS